MTSLFQKIFSANRKLGKKGLSPIRRHDLMIFDDFFPQPLSTFRFLEYLEYLRHFPSSVIYTTGSSLPLGDASLTLDGVLSDFEQTYPEFRGRVRRYDPSERLQGRLAYNIFVNNCDTFAPTIEVSQTAVVFTLYPGGGFCLKEKRSDDILRRVMGASSFRKVIVTQKITQDYLLENAFCDHEQIEFIYGGVAPRDEHGDAIKPHFQDPKKTFDVCFVAQKYMSQGRDKGYDVFIEVARHLATLCPEARFHVVGSFTPADVDITGLGDRITFHGTRERAFFHDFYWGMDIIVSPNAPFLLGPGAFDGFPTGCCVEAGMSGVVVMATDCLGQNIVFQDGHEILIIPRDVDGIVERIEELYRDSVKLRVLSSQTREAFGRVYSFEAQMGPRRRLLETVLREGE